MYTVILQFYLQLGRDEQYAEWSQAGTMGQLTCGGPWVCLFPEDFLPEEGSEGWKALQADMEPGLIRDRRQEVVIIGSDLNKEAITKALDDCLLEEGENDFSLSGIEGEEIDPEDVKKNGWKFGWKINKGEENPLPTWPDPTEMINNLFMDPEVNELQTFIILFLDLAIIPCIFALYCII